MAYIILLLAVLAAAAAAVLFIVDARQRGTSSEKTENGTTEDIVEVEPEPQPEPASRTASHRSSGLQLPGTVRRERRQWAQEHGFDFNRHDPFLSEEFSRGAAAGGASARDIVSGWAYNHELVLLDLGGTNVMGMRTSQVSDVVVDFRRQALAYATASSSDLVEVEGVADFVAFGTDAGVVRRFIDVRVCTALEQLPDIVDAVWCEGEWVLAQTAEGSRSDQWDEMLAPLAMLADAARVLPPRKPELLYEVLEDFTPTRIIPTQPPRELTPPGPAADSHDDIIPVIHRPEEPVSLPTRTLAEGYGEASEAMGIAPGNGEEIGAIADGTTPTHPDDPSQVRMRRDLSGGSTIFDDGPVDQN